MHWEEPVSDTPKAQAHTYSGEMNDILAEQIQTGHFLFASMFW